MRNSAQYHCLAMDKMRLTSLILCAIFILFGCGSDETSAPIEQKPNYFPDAVGSRWVYQDSKGLQWTREVSSETNIEGKNYRVFKDTPPNRGSDLDFLNSIYYRVTPNQVLSIVGDKIEHYVKTEIPKAAQDEFAGLELTAVVEPISYPELVLFQIPLIRNLQWNAFNVTVAGNIILQNLVLLQIPFEVDISIKAEVVAESSLGTPAGSFEEVYRIEYRTEITHTLFSADETIQQNLTVWFVPHIGIVKVENEQGVTELIAYTLASASKN